MKLSQKEQVIELLKSIESGDKEPFQFINENVFTQHNLSAADGVVGFADIIDALSTYPQKAKVVIKRVFVDGDYVVVHSDYNFFGEKVGFDIFRFEEGKIVEHWDNMQEKPKGTNPSGRTMTDGETEVSDWAFSLDNKELIEHFANEILIEKQYQNMELFFNGDNYIQHNPQIGDGLDSFAKTMSKWANEGVVLDYKSVHKVLGEGDFVLLVCSGLFGKEGGKEYSFYDLFRVENGKIAEHWDVMEPILDESLRKNSNSKFDFIY